MRLRETSVPVYAFWDLSPEWKGKCAQVIFHTGGTFPTATPRGFNTIRLATGLKSRPCTSVRAHWRRDDDPAHRPVRAGTEGLGSRRERSYRNRRTSHRTRFAFEA